MGQRFSDAVVRILRSGGWFEERNVAPTEGLPQPSTVFSKAKEVLSEFRGLHFGKCGAGIDIATSDVNIDPALGVYLLPELRAYESSLGTRLFPLGEVHRGHGYLLIDEQGRTYLLSDKLEPLASSFPQALELLLLGRRTPPVQ